MSEKKDNPQVFISYSHDDNEHKKWVLELATRLRSNGLNVILDQWNLKLGEDIASYMEKGISKSIELFVFVLIIMSKKLMKEKEEQDMKNK